MCTRLLLALALVAGIGAGAAAPAAAADRTTFDLSLAAGLAGNDFLENSHSAFLLAPGLRFACAEPPCFALKNIIIVWPKRKDPVWTRQPLPEPFPPFEVADLDIGPTWGALPELAISWPGESPWTPSVFLGAGFLVDEGQTTRVGNQSIRTQPVDSPAISYGLGVDYELNDRLALQLQARGITAFPDQLTILATPENGRTTRHTVEGGRMQLSMVTAGVRWRF